MRILSASRPFGCIGWTSDRLPQPTSPSRYDPQVSRDAPWSPGSRYGSVFGGTRLAILDESPGVIGCHGLPGRSGCPKHGTQLSRQLPFFEVDIFDRDGPPVLAVHRSIDDERDAELVTPEIIQTENPTAIKEIPRLSARQQRGKLARREFVEVYQRDSLGTIVTDRMRIGLVAVPKRLSVHVVEIHFEDRRLTRVAHVPQPPFPSCMFVRGPPDREPLA